ncbi:alpha/beta hydrolase [Microbulbifer flavimaris]|uniref:Alpha/beta hydrolase n=1 Tax=Microbulbifer flavimaris TaxID=1781068 RepID=A0ABX4I2C5_9GAMM|nr:MULTISPECIES: alpha/beta hydrolase [Microbulbifer]KUJ84482.1 hypothetical protein AVO43_01940 [Microbulbifer sp. ZGT114]PCO06570.1 alpha/beta hydrolase [Microbulbifer flavimaris]
MKYAFLTVIVLIAAGCGGTGDSSRSERPDASANDQCPHSNPAVCIDDLADLSIDSLRARPYQSKLALLERPAPAPLPHADTLLASYDSDGLRIYTRIDIPHGTPPQGGFPLAIFSHGWVGIEAAPGYQFGLNHDSFYGEIVAALTGAGFAVLSPGFRGHGTVGGVPAEGHEFMQVWDNGSYLSPSFYAIDLVNLLAALRGYAALEWASYSIETPRLDLDRVNLLGHSQGGDAALTALAITGDNPNTGQFHAASIWSGNIPDKLTQANTFGPMGASPQAFLAGDGSWNGTATDGNGHTNADFVFGFPPDWIGTPHPAEWTWQRQTWSTGTVLKALTDKYRQMYETINRYVLNIDDATFTISRDDNGQLQIDHDPRIATALASVSAYPAAKHISVPLALHFSDRDYYSLPAWNQRLQNNILKAGGMAYAFEYPGTTHSLKVSQHDWFSPAGTQPGVACALARDALLFNGDRPDARNCKDFKQVEKTEATP